MRNDSGQALVELALVLPFLVVLIVAVLYVTELGVARLALEHAAAEGARIGALTNDDAQVEGAIAAALAPLPRERVAVRIAPRQSEDPRARDPRGSLLRIELSYVVAAPLAFAGLPAITARGTAARIVEWTP